MNKFKYILIISAVAASVSCTKNFAERNTNPEEATDGMLDWDNLRIGSAFSQMTRNVIPSYQMIGSEEYGSNSYQVVQDLTGNLFAGYIGVINTGFKANNLYDLTANTWYEAQFKDAYVRATPSWVDLDAVREDNPEAAALADILKVAVLHRVTDTYGPIPYSQLGSGAVQMAYDSQESIYKSFFKELGAAIDVLTAFWQAQPNTKLLESFDNVFSGDVGKWIKFANTLRLRLATRVSYVDEALYFQQAEAAMANPAGLMDEAVYLHRPTSGAWENPVWMVFYDFDDDRIGATIETYMNGYEDPRRSSYFTAGSDGGYHGVRGGIVPTAAYGASDMLSFVNATNDDDLKWMSAGESSFLRAEYWLRKGDNAQAKTFYEQGVKNAFSEAKASGVDAYLQGTTSPGTFTDVVNGSNSYNTKLTSTPVKWDESGDFETNLEQIITQKYIACWPEGQEAWSEFRRTGYPKVIPFSVNNSGGMIDTQQQIRRMNYPATEYRTNDKNVNSAVAVLNGESSQAKGDNGGTRVWWDKNTRF